MESKFENIKEGRTVAIALHIFSYCKHIPSQIFYCKRTKKLQVKFAKNNTTLYETHLKFEQDWIIQKKRHGKIKSTFERHDSTVLRGYWDKHDFLVRDKRLNTRESAHSAPKRTKNQQNSFCKIFKLRISNSDTTHDDNESDKKA